MADNNPTPTPDSNDNRVTAAIDGEITPEIERLLAEDVEFAEEVRSARRFESKLKSALFRWDCPTPQQLGDYHLQLVSQADAAQIKTHVVHCIYCQAELRELIGFLAQDQPVTSAPKTEKTNWGLPRFGEILAQLLSPLPQTSAVGLRGADDGPKMLQADDITIFIETEQENDQFLLKGQLAADQLDEWYGAMVQVVQVDAIQAVTVIDDEGTFQFALNNSDPINIRIANSSGKTILIQDFSLV